MGIGGSLVAPFLPCFGRNVSVNPAEIAFIIEVPDGQPVPKIITIAGAFPRMNAPGADVPAPPVRLLHKDILAFGRLYRGYFINLFFSATLRPAVAIECSRNIVAPPAVAYGAVRSDSFPIAGTVIGI